MKSIDICFRANAKTAGKAIFNFDALLQGQATKGQRFLKALTAEKWKRIPSDLLDDETSQNFNCYAKLSLL
jgi:hypothetical protein